MPRESFGTIMVFVSTTDDVTNGRSSKRVEFMIDGSGVDDIESVTIHRDGRVEIRTLPFESMDPVALDSEGNVVGVPGE